MSTFTLRLDRIAQHVEVRPGGEIRVTGSYTSTLDGATIDAATTTWPDDTPGGASVDAGGMIDFQGGGFHVTSRDPKTHEVVAVATGEPGALCQKLGVESPCLPLRVLPHSQTRLVTMQEWTQSLKGAITVEVVVPPPPPAYAPAVDFMSHPATLGVLGATGLCAVLGLAWVVARRRKLSPAGQLRTIAARLRKKLEQAEPAMRATVMPVAQRAEELINARHVDAASKEGQRIRDLLLRAEEQLERSKVEKKQAIEQAAADELVAEMEAALAAAEEADRAAGYVS